MSGIAGIVRFDGQPALPAELDIMLEAISHRGPDCTGRHCRDGIAMGHVLLATTPEAVHEQQPLVSADGHLVLVMDGRLDNWQELRRELKIAGMEPRGRTDDELVLLACKAWGEACLQRLEGDFAFVLWDQRSRQVLCARDPAGNRPLHYYRQGPVFAFASELHALLALPWISERPNQKMLAQLLGQEWHSREQTLWQDIQRLPAAHSLLVTDSTLKKQCYWSPDLYATIYYADDQDYVEHYRELLADIVRRQSRSQAPVTYEVSGGLDSSSLFAMAHYLARNQLLMAPSVIGATLDFSGVPGADELSYCRAVADFAGADIHELEPGKPALGWYRAWSDKYREFPGMPNGVMALPLMEHAVACGSRVICSGAGGDEWLGAGEARYAEELYRGNLRQLGRFFLEDRAREGVAGGGYRLLRYGVMPLLPSAVKRRLRRILRRYRPYDVALWLQAPLQRELCDSRRESSAVNQPRALRWPGQEAELAVLECAYAIFAHESMERLAASVGVELRRPLSHPRLVQFSFSVPKRMLSDGEYERTTHRMALRGLLPDKVLQRQTKAHFNTMLEHYVLPLRDYLRDELPLLHPDWIQARDLSRLCLDCEDEENGSAALFALWTLFACDAIFPSAAAAQSS